MSSEHTISIATASRDGGRGERPVSMPVDELVASNGLVTGQAGADTVSSVQELTESLLDAGESVFVVDPASDFDDVADHPSVLHVGGDRDCDVRVEPSAVDRVAALALEGNTSIVLDLSAFDASGADDLVGSLTAELVEGRRGSRSDLLLVVNECHRWLADSGPATRTGEHLVQLGGRRHDGVGIVGITDQPADVRDDVLNGVDWVLAHRLTWEEDVRALEGMLDRTHVEALERLDDDEAIFNAGWEGRSQRIEVGLGEGSESNGATGRPQQSADGDDLFAGLPEARSRNATDADAPQRDATEESTTGDQDPAEVEALHEELSALENRIASLEAKLEARAEVEDMADRIADAITEGLEDANHGPSSTESGSVPADSSPAEPSGTVDDSDSGQTDGEGASGDEDAADDPGGFGDVFGMFDDDSTDAAEATGADDGQSSSPTNGTAQSDSGPAAPSESTAASSANGSPASPDAPEPAENDGDGAGMSFEPIDFSFEETSQDIDSTVPDDFGPPSRHGSSGRTIPRYLRKIVRGIEEMDVTTRRMLAYYIEEGTESPMDAHFSAGGGGDRTRAYAHNRQLRTNGLIEHVGKGKYAPRLREYVVDEAGHSVPDHELDRAVDIIHQAVEEA